jgi:hypothetical protein
MRDTWPINSVEPTGGSRYGQSVSATIVTRDSRRAVGPRDHAHWDEIASLKAIGGKAFAEWYKDSELDRLIWNQCEH